MFSCWATGVESFHWRVNGTDTESDSLTSQIKADLIKDYSKHGVFHISTLSVTARINYNGTRVQCTVEGMGRLLLSETATLIIQGNIIQWSQFRYLILSEQIESHLLHRIPPKTCKY